MIYMIFKRLYWRFLPVASSYPHCCPLKIPAQQEAIGSMEEREKDANMCEAGGNLAWDPYYKKH